MSTERIVGIDLGTTNSLVAFMPGERPVVIPGEDGLNLVPSVVALDDKDQVIVGNAARKYLIETPERAVYSIKRLMGRGIEDIEQELKLFPSAWPTIFSPAKCCASSWAKRLSLRRRFPPACCASSSAMPSDSSMRR